MNFDMKAYCLGNIPGITERQAEQFSVYCDMLIDWNSRMNLTAITEPQKAPTEISAFWAEDVPYWTGENTTVFPNVPAARTATRTFPSTICCCSPMWTDSRSKISTAGTSAGGH